MALTNKQQYIENALNDLFKLWLSRASLMGAGIFLSLSLLDLMSTPEHFWPFFGYRVIVTVILLGIYSRAKVYPADSVRVHRSLALAGVICSAAAIELMILQFHGHRSSYYAGMIVLGICAIGFIPARMSFHFTTAGIIYALYAIPILLHEPINDVRAFFTHNTFLIASLATALMLRHMSYRSLITELGLRYEYEQHRTSLAEEVNARTAQLNNTIGDLQRAIKERERMESALRESEAKFRTLFEESRDVIYISVPGGRFLDINPAGVELFGYASKEELLALDITHDLYVDAAERDRFVALVDRTGYAKEYEVRMKRKNGEVLTVLITSTTVRDKSGNLTAFRGIMRDVTNQKNLEEQLLQSQKMEAVGQLAGGIAHDFNNILTAIIGYAGLLEMNLPTDDVLHSYVEHIHSSSERAASLIQSLLAFSRKQVINPRPVDLNDIVRRIEKLLVRLIGEDIELRTVLGRKGLIVVADSLQIEQVLMNLSTNARDAMPRGGRFTIETSSAQLGPEFVLQDPDLKPGHYALLSVSDTGSGMDEATRKRIFEPFFTTKEIGKGTGLGLAMVYGIVKQHEGHITVYSSKIQGTSFHIYLPLVSSRGIASLIEQRSDPVVGGTETVLLGEDDDTVRTMTASMLREFGYTVISAKDGEEALRKFEEHGDAIDLLILDVIMPRMNGKEVYDRVTKIDPGARILFTSGYTAEIIRTRGIIKPGLNFVQKPISMQDLLRKIRQVLDRPN